MSHHVITIGDKGDANPNPLGISMKNADTVQWQSTGADEWMVVFRGSCPFTDRDFHVPANASSRVAQQSAGLQDGERYIYTVVTWPPKAAGGAGTDPAIDIKP